MKARDRRLEAKSVAAAFLPKFTMTKILRRDEIVTRAYFVVERMFDATWRPEDKLMLLKQTAPYVEGIAKAEAGSFLRSRDQTLTDFERTLAGRDMGILRAVANLVDDFSQAGMLDGRQKVH